MEISEIKSQLNIISLAEHYGHQPNRNHLIKCPFHEDDKPSLQLYPATNTWHCFGCGKGTDTIDLIQNIENCTTHEAILKAKAFLNQYLPINTNIMKEEITTRQITKEQRIQGLTAAFKYFSQSLKVTTKAQEYLKGRAIDYTRIIAGYDNHNFHQNKRADKELQQLYLELGLIFPDRKGRKDSYHSRFDGCIVFPTFDEQGNIVSMYGRKIEVAEGEGGHYKLPGEHQGLYPKYPATDTETLIITECIIDAATLLQHSFITEKYTLLSLYGAKIWTEEHSKVIANLHRLKEIIFALDGDEQGREGTQKHSESVKQINSKLKISYIEITDNEDINSIAQGHTPEIFTELINNRKSISNTNHFFLFSTAEAGGKGMSPEKQETTPSAQEAGNGQPVTTIPGKEKNTSVLSSSASLTGIVSEAETPIKTTVFNGQENHQTTGKLDTSNPSHIYYETKNLKITLQGGIELYNLKRLRVTMHIQLKVNVYNDYRDTIDLYSNSQRKRLIQEVSEKLEQSSAEISQVITDFTNRIEHYRNQKLEQRNKEEEAQRNKDKETFTQQEMQQGAALLSSKDLMQKTYEKISRIGLIGQEINGMLLFFIYLTRMYKEPLHAIVQGRSGSGKTYLLKKIAGLLPKNHYKSLTAITENSLYYALQGMLQNMLLLLEDMEGMYKALLPIRELMTNLFIRKWTTITNNKTGEQEQKELYVEGPVCIAGATTHDKIYEDNANRSFQIQIEESQEQEEKVLEYQRKEAAGLINPNIEDNIQREFKTAQLLLHKDLEVVISFAEELKIPEHVFKKQRTNKHYLILIKSIALWNQKKRDIKQKSDGTRFIEATIEDVSWANLLSKEALLRKSDELSPQVRNFFEHIKEELKKGNQKSFIAKPIRERYRLNPMKLNRYLHELESRGYIRQISGNRKTGYEYEIKIWNDYEQLQQSMQVLDEIYNRLKEKQEKEREVKNEKN